MSERDPLDGLQLTPKLHKCAGCGAELKMVDQGADAPHRWMLYHAEPRCDWFGQRVAQRQAELASEREQRELEQQQRAAIDAAVERAKKGGCS